MLESCSTIPPLSVSDIVQGTKLRGSCNYSGEIFVNLCVVCLLAMRLSGRGRKRAKSGGLKEWKWRDPLAFFFCTTREEKRIEHLSMSI